MFSQQRYDDYNLPPNGASLPFVGISNDVTRNINNADAVDFQDLKKSVCYLLWKSDEDQKFHQATGFLVNTVNNSYVEQHNEAIIEIYLLTVEHNDLPSSGEGDLYISFDYEVADPDKLNDDEINSEEYASIRRLWSLSIDQLVSSVSGVGIEFDIDLALYKIKRDSNYPFSIENSEVYQHVYVSGWTLHPSIEHIERIASIGHPRGDIKKFMNNPGEPLMYTPYTETNHESMFKYLQYDLDEEFFIEYGSSGSPIFFDDKVFALVSRYDLLQHEVGIPIENFWKDYEDEFNHEVLATYLDPKGTWISSVKGGYLKDLIENDENEFNLEFLKTETRKANLRISTKDFFPSTSLVGENREDALGHGMIINDQDGGRRYLTLRSSDNLNALLYGSYYEYPLNEQIAKPFLGKGWLISEGIDNMIPPIADNHNLESTDMRNLILKYLRDSNNYNHNIEQGLEDFYIDAIAEIKTNAESSSALAVKFPHQMPYNAVELFKPIKLKDMWRSYHYKKGAGEITDNEYFIDNIKIEFEQNLLIDGECISIDRKTLKEIKTGDNGGYLNLVNPNYEIKDIVASDEDCDKNTLIITITTGNNKDKYYGAWLDYDRARIDGEQLNPDDNYTYDFKINPSADLPSEQLMVGSTKEQTIKIKHQVPNVEDLVFDADKTFKTRLRLAIAQAPEENNESLTSYGTYEKGEVEDYLVEIREPNDGDSNEAILATAKIDLRAAKRQRTNADEPNNPTLSSSRAGISNQLQSSNSGGNTNPGMLGNAALLQHPLGVALEGNVITNWLDNQGTEEGVISFLFQQIQSMYTQHFASLPNDPIHDPNGANNPIKTVDLTPDNFFNSNNPFNPNNNNGNPANEFNPLASLASTDGSSTPSVPSFDDPFNGADWDDIMAHPDNRSMFKQLYDNFARIALYVNDPLEILFNKYTKSYYDGLDLKHDYFWIFKSFKDAVRTQNEDNQAFNQAVLFGDFIEHIYYNGVIDSFFPPDFSFTKAALIFLFNPDLIRSVVPAGYPYIDAGIIMLHYIRHYVLIFGLAMSSIPWLIDNGSKAINFIGNEGTIAIDYSGNWISKNYSERIISSQLALANYPKDEELAVIYHIKGSNNQLALVIDKDGYLVYRIKLETEDEWKQIKSTKIIPTGKIIDIAVRFDNGWITLFLDGEKIGSGGIFDKNGTRISQIPAFTDFTTLNHGARWGGPVTHFSGQPDSNDDPNLVHIDALFYRFSAFDKAFTDATIKGIRSINTTPTTRKTSPINQPKETKISAAGQITKDGASEAASSDFSIFPNPAKTELNIIVEVQQAGQLSVNIFDLAGKQVYEMQESEISKGHQLITLRNLKLSAGQYIVKVKAGNVSQSEQVVFE